MSMQGSAMMYVTAASLPTARRGDVSSSTRADELVDDLRRPLHERRFRRSPGRTRRVRALEPVRVRVVREAEDRDVRARRRRPLGVDARDVADHEIGRVDAVARDEWCPAAAPRASPRKKRSTPTSRIVATRPRYTTAPGSRGAATVTLDGRDSS